MASGHERPWFLVGVRKYLASFSIYLVVAQWSRQNRHLLRRKKIHEMKSVKIKYGHRSGSLTKKLNCVGLNPTDRISPCSTKCGDTRSRECDKWEWRGLANEWSEMHPLAHSLCVHTTSAVAVVIFFSRTLREGETSNEKKAREAEIWRHTKAKALVAPPAALVTHFPVSPATWPMQLENVRPGPLLNDEKRDSWWSIEFSVVQLRKPLLD